MGGTSIDAGEIGLGGGSVVLNERIPRTVIEQLVADMVAEAEA